MSVNKFRPTVLITSGGTTEPIDSVRCMTNVSTGKTSARIAEWFHHNNFRVVYIHGQGAELPDIGSWEFTPIEVITAEDACTQILINAGDADVIIHAMAVSDFS